MKSPLARSVLTGRCEFRFPQTSRHDSQNSSINASVLVPAEYGWLNDQQFLAAVAVAMMTPGPVVITVGFMGCIVAAGDTQNRYPAGHNRIAAQVQETLGTIRDCGRGGCQTVDLSFLSLIGGQAGPRR